MGILFEICACEEDLKVLKGMEVTSVVDYTDDSKEEGVHIDFVGPSGQCLTLSISENSELHRSVCLQPLFCAQDLRNYEGYTIAKVESDEIDLECRAYLEDGNGKTVILHPDKALDGETLFVEE